MGVGWEVSGSGVQHCTSSRGRRWQVTQGLTAGRWHLVEVAYNRGANTLEVWLNGQLLSRRSAPLAAGRSPAYSGAGRAWIERGRPYAGAVR